MPKIYIIRHAAGMGQEPDAPLTVEGRFRAQALANTLAPLGIVKLWSSPARRALETVQPLAEELKLPITQDERLMERVLSAVAIPDWREQLKASFDDFDKALPGGETSREAMWRAEAVWADIVKGGEPAAVVTHGNLMTLMLRSLNPRWGFEAWDALGSPDVYLAESHLAGWTLSHMPIGP